jgi:hypothetical protein
MPTRISPWYAVAIFAFIAPLFASDITGEWRAVIRRTNAVPATSIFEFKVEDNTLTGAMLDFETEEPILDGKVKDDHVSFKIQDDVKRTTFTYKGKIVGDTIRFRVVANSGVHRILEFTATRIGNKSGLLPDPSKDPPDGDKQPLAPVRGKISD